MFDFLLILTGMVIVASMIASYRRSGDPLSPAVVFGPMMLFVYFYSPFMLHRQGELGLYFSADDLLYVQMVNLAGVAAFCLGLMKIGRVRLAGTGGWGFERLTLTPATRRRLVRLAMGLGVVAVTAFALTVWYSGGLTVFKQAKPYLRAPSGYISEAGMLAYPALLLLAIGWQGRRLTLGMITLALLIASPHLIMGTLGARRGPAFLILATLGVCWFLVRNRRPAMRTVLGGVAVLGLLMLFLVSNRRIIHLGSDFEVNTESFLGAVKQDRAAEGHEFVYASGRMLMTNRLDAYDWGKSYAVLIFIRPIPKFIWPTKFQDVGMTATPGLGGFAEEEWQHTLGFVPTTGSSGSFIADLYCSFWWLGLVVCYGIGRLYVASWRRCLFVGGMWAIIYVELLALSVYLPSQSIGAWLHRALLLTIPTYLFWKMTLGRSERNSKWSPQAKSTIAVKG